MTRRGRDGRRRVDSDDFAQRRRDAERPLAGRWGRSSWRSPNANTQVSPTRTFAYDALYRLVRAEGREKDGLTQTTHELPAVGGLPDSGNPALRRYTQSYQYDGVGNLLEMKHQLGSGGSVLWKRDYVYASGSNRLLTTTMGQSTLDYDYDARGALSNVPHLQGFTRDFRDQLRKVVLDLAGNEAWYAHDGAGQRVRKLVDKGAVTEERIYVGGWEVWRKRVNGTLDEERTTLHVRDGERRVAMVETKTVVGGQAVGSPVARWRFQLDDQLGSAVSECDDEGGVFSYEELHPYGSVAWSAVDSALDVSPRRYRYTGMERDEETGLQAHGVRMYAPWLGRWDRPDPIGLGDGVNRWGYVHGGPQRGRDASGRADESATLDFSSKEAREVLRIASDGESVRRFKADMRDAASSDGTVQVHVGGQTYTLTGASRGSLVAGRENNFAVSRNAAIESARGLGDLMTLTSSQPVKSAWRGASDWLGKQKTLYNVDEEQGARAEFMAQVAMEEVAGAGVGAAVHGLARAAFLVTSPAPPARNIVYRALSEADVESLASSRGLVAKAPDGTWTAAEHVANYGPGVGGAAANSPWISTTRVLDVARAYDSGHGIVAIDLDAVQSFSVEVWRHAPRVNGPSGLAYHRSIWSQEVTVHLSIQHDAVLGAVR